MNDLSRPTRQRSRASRRDPSPDILSGSDSEEENSRKRFSSFGGTGILCAHCEKEGCGWFCIGPCRRGFHTKCKDKGQHPSLDSSLPTNEEL